MSGRDRVQQRMGMTRLQYLVMIFGQACFYCREEFPMEELTRDHVTPRALGGDDSLANQVPACKPCNQRKGCRPPTDEELRRMRRIWNSTVSRKLRKKHAPPCYVCNGNTAHLVFSVCPECGRTADGKYILRSA